jgi:hypothetical protein
VQWHTMQPARRPRAGMNEPSVIGPPATRSRSLVQAVQPTTSPVKEDGCRRSRRGQRPTCCSFGPLRKLNFPNGDFCAECERWEEYEALNRLSRTIKRDSDRNRCRRKNHTWFLPEQCIVETFKPHTRKRKRKKDEEECKKKDASVAEIEEGVQKRMRFRRMIARKKWSLL